jgi:ABC-type amino acid transport substrate-binding protein/cytochrome c5
VLILLSVCAAGDLVAADESTPLRFCADPANLPFSNADAGNPGIYVEMGALIAQAIGRDMTTVWRYTYYGKRTIRTTLLAGLCDATVGLPDADDFMGPRVIYSKPLLELGYALVSPAGHAIKSVADLKGARVGVQFESEPQNYLATRDDVQAVTYLEPGAAMQALAAGKIDAAFIWGPIAGYMNKRTYDGAYAITPVAGPGMQWQAAVGFSGKNAALRDAVDAILPDKAEDIKMLRERYGFPTGAPIALNSSGVAESDQAPLQPGTSAATEAQSTTSATAANVERGRELFNGTCAHCHGPNAVQSERRIDLRLLRHRYGDDMDKTFMTTVTQGRPSKGMPNWRDVFTVVQLADILAYLHTLQTPDPKM